MRRGGRVAIQRHSPGIAPGRQEASSGLEKKFFIAEICMKSFSRKVIPLLLYTLWGETAAFFVVVPISSM